MFFCVRRVPENGERKHFILFATLKSSHDTTRNTLMYVLIIAPEFSKPTFQDSYKLIQNYTLTNGGDIGSPITS